MGFQEKLQVDEGIESEAKKWLIAGMSIRTALKPLSMKPREKEGDNDDEEARSTTPTAKEARIPERLTCPPAPRKRRPSKCHYNGAIEFFTPPDLETVFILRVERAS